MVSADKSWLVTWDGAMRVSAVEDHVPGFVRGAEGMWIALDQIARVESWIDGPASGVRLRLADGTTASMFESDSGNVDPTATWNEYLFDGAWAFGAARQLAEWLGVPHVDT